MVRPQLPDSNIQDSSDNRLGLLLHKKESWIRTFSIFFFFCKTPASRLKIKKGKIVEKEKFLVVKNEGTIIQNSLEKEQEHALFI